MIARQGLGPEQQSLYLMVTAHDSSYCQFIAWCVENNYISTKVHLSYYFTRGIRALHFQKAFSHPQNRENLRDTYINQSLDLYCALLPSDMQRVYRNALNAIHSTLS